MRPLSLEFSVNFSALHTHSSGACFVVHTWRTDIQSAGLCGELRALMSAER